jgi:uncharacterized protein (TIGR02145 family)
MKNSALLFIALLTISSFGFSQTVKIGNQVWTNKNLNVATFRNGETIPQAKTDEEWSAASQNKKAAWCYYGNDPKNGTKYGKLYNWYAINDPRGLAPLGYHIPTDQEWTVLSNFLGGRDVAGKKMKSSSGWPRDNNGTNSSAFAGLPGGYRSYDGELHLIGSLGHWWSASEDDESYGMSAWFQSLGQFDIYVQRDSQEKGHGMSVRCVKD